ncbi:glycosyltransferase [Micromonospora arborensis]|uniref:glycosyltransferase n=1 Tax=Micromonospora arborensis TaxID=2116518 RepID=UPI00340F6E51
MRLIFASIGAYGHLIPLLPLAVAARDAGHEVTFATDKRFHPMLHDAGLTPVAAGSTVREAIATVRAEVPAGQPFDASPRAFGSVLARRMVADLAPVLREQRPDLMIYEVLTPGAGMAATLAGIPAICHSIGRLTGGPMWSAMSAAWLATAAELGIEAPTRDADFLGNRYLDVCPPSFQLPGFATSAERILMRPGTWRQSADLPALVRERDRDRPLVYLTLGTAFGTPELLRQTIAGLAKLPVDLLVAAAGPTGGKGALGDLPPNVVVESWVPQGDLLPHVDLVVSHGGGSTVLEVLANGLPHLMLPQGADQFSNARAVADIGAGRQVMPGEFSAEVVFSQAEALLVDEQARACADKLASEIGAMPSPEETVGRLVEAAA